MLHIKDLDTHFIQMMNVAFKNYMEHLAHLHHLHHLQLLQLLALQILLILHMVQNMDLMVKVELIQIESLFIFL